MQHEHTYRPSPCCPSCGTAMRYVRSVGGLPELRTYECRACGLSITEALEPKGFGDWFTYMSIFPDQRTDF
jgi:hypothetical protein